MGMRRIFGLEGILRSGRSEPQETHTELGQVGVRKLVDTTREGVWLFDLQGRTTYVNRRMANMLGVEPNELVGARLVDFLERNERVEAERDLRAWLEDGAEGRYRHLLRRDGRDLWTRVSSSAVEDRRHGVVGMLGMFTDATDARDMEQALLRAETQFRIVFDSSPVGIVVVNLEGYAVLANATMLKMLGYVREEIQRVSFEDVTHPDDVAEDRRLYDALMRGDVESFRREKRYVTRSGRILWVHVNASLVRSPAGEPQYAISMVEDVTEMRNAERALRDSSSQLRHALDAAHMVIWQWDLRTGAIEWSDNVHRVFNIEPSQTPMTRDALEQIVIPEDRARVIGEIDAALRTPGAKFVSTFRVMTLEGDERCFEVRGEGERNDAGVPQCLLGTVVDVTARRRAEELLQQSRERELRVQEEFSRHLLTAQEQERQRLANELHDGLGQSLSLIRNRMQLALELDGVPPAVVEHLRAVEEIASDCVREVRNLAQNLRPMQIGQFGVSESLVSLVDRVRDSSALSFDYRIEDVDDVMEGESAMHLYRICQEALNNVLKHSHAPSVSVTLERDVGMLRLEVRDDGVGFDVAGRGASGLGLTSMRERAQILGGTLDVQSEPGRGTRVRIGIPFTEPAERA